jgi:hypothetical protein
MIHYTRADGKVDTKYLNRAPVCQAYIDEHGLENSFGHPGFQDWLRSNLERFGIDPVNVISLAIADRGAYASSGEGRRAPMSALHAREVGRPRAAYAFAEAGDQSCPQAETLTQYVSVRSPQTVTLEVHSYLWFGNAPGQALPNLREMKVAKHAKANAAGVKLERPNQRVVPRSAFTPLASLDAVLERLFGSLP